MKTTKEIELDIHPDRNALDDEWCNQPRLRFRYGQELAEARMALSSAKAEMDVVTAELELDIRDAPERYGLEKVTEGAIKAKVPTLGAFQTTKKRVIKCQHAVDVLDAAVSAIDHRKKALEDLVQLYLADYYSKPKAPQEAREQMDEMAKNSVRRRGRETSGEE